MMSIIGVKFRSILLLIGIVEVVSAVQNNAYLLQDHRSYSLVISVTNQIGLKSTGNDSQVFAVVAPKYHRVMIVIQQLHLWPEIDKESQSYLQFVDSDGSTSKKIYGNIDPEETELVPQYLTGPRSFASSGDSASLVFINLRPDHIIRSKNERRVYAKVVFTAFRDTCSYRSMPPPPENATKSFTRSNEIIYRSCTTSSANGKNCIAAELFCNNNINCGDSDEHKGNIGVDENYMNCDQERRRNQQVTNLYHNSLSNDDRRGRTTSRKQKSMPDDDSDFIKTLIVDQEYDEYFTELFKSVIIGFLGLCTTCILIAFVVTMFCMKNSRERNIDN